MRCTVMSSYVWVSTPDGQTHVAEVRKTRRRAKDGIAVVPTSGGEAFLYFAANCNASVYRLYQVETEGGQMVAHPLGRN